MTTRDIPEESTESMGYFLNPSELDYELPGFAAVERIFADNAMIPALKTALVDHAAEIAAIADNPEEPTWDNTFTALEESGQMLDRVLAIIYNYAGTMATDQVVAIEEEASPLVAEHYSNLLLNEVLWRRIQAIPEQSEGSEEAALQKYWVERFRRGGADLAAEQRAEMREIDTRLAALSTQFGNQLQKATRAAGVLITDQALLAGLGQDEMDSLHQAAIDDGRIAAGESGWLIRLGLPSVQPILESLDDPRARQLVYEASLGRTAGGAAGEAGAGGATDGALRDIVRLRARRAELLGYRHHADYVAAQETAGSLDAVEELLNKLTPPAVANAQGEYKRVVDMASVAGAASGADAELATPAEVTGADWPYWAAKLRAEESAVDEAELKKYFPLQQVLVDGAFYAAERLYNISMRKRDDLQGYHPDVEVWEVYDNELRTGLGLLLTDMYARSTKRGGAWMSSFVDQSNLIGQPPVVVNVLNIAKPAGEGAQALLTLDEVATVFHEFGHALHGLLSDVRYPSLSGTSVPRDFVEFPSQINENWALEPEILANYARHVDTGEPLPQHMLAAVREQAKYGQGFATTEYLAACWLDLAWHSLSVEEAAAVDDVDEFERRALETAGVTVESAIAPRYRSAFFNHIFAGGYSADYWSYVWAEVLDADGFQAFVDTGAARREISDAQLEIDPDDVRFAGERFRRMILSRGATIDYTDAFWMFRGQEKSVEPLLQRRGLSSSGGN